MDEEMDEGPGPEEGQKSGVGGLLEGYSEEQNRIEGLRTQAMQKFVDELNQLVEQKEREIVNLKDRNEERENKINDFKKQLNDLLSDL